MSSTTRKSEWVVLGGVALVALGAWLLAERVFGWLFYPLSRVLHVLGNVGWPLVLVGLGVLLVMRGRNGGWTSTGKLFRSRTDRKIAGVLGGAAVYFGIDSSLARLVYAVRHGADRVLAGLHRLRDRDGCRSRGAVRVLGGRHRTGRSSGSVGACRSIGDGCTAGAACDLLGGLTGMNEHRLRTPSTEGGGRG